MRTATIVYAVALIAAIVVAGIAIGLFVRADDRAARLDRRVSALETQVRQAEERRSSESAEAETRRESDLAQLERLVECIPELSSRVDDVEAAVDAFGTEFAAPPRTRYSRDCLSLLSGFAGD